VRELAAECGFEIAGVARVEPLAEAEYYRTWMANGMAGEMHYLTGRRGDMRDDPRTLLPAARSVICVGKLYNSSRPYSTAVTLEDQGWISRYAWGDDYHDVIRKGLARLESMLREEAGEFESKICVDTAPLLERALARRAGLGWIGKNTSLINQARGSWFFLGELLVSLDITPDTPPPDRCGTCTRCIDACPTSAIVTAEGPGWAVDSRLCISYFTIELRGTIPEEHRGGIGLHVFGCDICQDVCPWNGRAGVSAAFEPRYYAPPLERLAALSEDEFREMFRETPVTRARYAGFLRNVCVAMGNSGSERFRLALERLAAHTDPVIGEHARWALDRLSAMDEHG